MPPPSAVISDGVLTLPSSIFLSSTVKVVEFTVVVVPLTVKFPAIVMSLASFALVIEPLGTCSVQLNTPEPLVVSAYPLVPALLGNVRV